MTVRADTDPAGARARRPGGPVAILIGHRVKKFLNPRSLQPVAALAFAAVGIAFLIR